MTFRSILGNVLFGSLVFVASAGAGDRCWVKRGRDGCEKGELGKAYSGKGGGAIRCLVRGTAYSTWYTSGTCMVKASASVRDPKVVPGAEKVLPEDMAGADVPPPPAPTNDSANGI